MSIITNQEIITKLRGIYQYFGISFEIKEFSNYTWIHPIHFNNEFGKGDLYSDIEVYAPGDIPVPQTGSEGYKVRSIAEGKYVVNYSERGTEGLRYEPKNIDDILYFFTSDVVRDMVGSRKEGFMVCNPDVENLLSVLSAPYKNDDRIFWMGRCVSIIFSFNTNWAKRYIDDFYELLSCYGKLELDSVDKGIIDNLYQVYDMLVLKSDK